MSIASLIMVIQCVAIAVLFFELVFAVLQKPSKLQAHVIVLVIATIMMFAGYIIEICSSNLDEAIAGATVSYLGKPFIMLASFMFIASFYERKVPNIVFIVLAFLCCLFSIVVFTNNYHYLYYATTVYDPTQKYSPLVTTRGPLYYSYIVAAIVYFFACINTVISGLKKTKVARKKSLSIWIILMIVSGIGGYLIYISGITNGYDFTMFGVFISTICLFILFTRYRIFDSLSFAKDQALADSTTGLIVLNADDEIVYKNDILNTYEKDGIGKYLDYNATNSKHICKTNNKVFSIVTKDLYENSNYVGKAIEINDITVNHNYQKNLESAVNERTEKLENIQREIIASIANLIEARSTETGEHIKKVSNIVERIANELVNMGLYSDILTPEYINILISAAPLHDIGKISIPDTVLNKPGRLNKEEFEIVKNHVEYGAKIIENTLRGLESDRYVDIAKDIALYHHERWDGHGYKQSLVGSDIPLCARIVAVADVYDALTSKRCYKDEYSQADALAIIANENGSHFDPTIVHAFMSSLSEDDI